jgi:hypothetical protein
MMFTNSQLTARRPPNNSSPLSSTRSAPSRTRCAKSKGPHYSYWNQKRRRQSTTDSGTSSLRMLLATLSPTYFAREFLGFHPDPAQAKVLHEAVPHKRIALNCNRQWGKSTVAAILAVHRLFTHPGVTVLIVAPSGRQSGETLLKVAAYLAILGIAPRRDGVNERSLVLPNGSRIASLPAVDATVRGFSAVSMLIVDEASRVPDGVYLALRPCLAVSRGDLVLVSTPNGRRGFFYREMTQTGPGWFRHTGPVTECGGSRIPQEFLDEEKARGDTYYRQEYLCEFIETGKYLFDEQLLHQIVRKEAEAFAWL